MSVLILVDSQFGNTARLAGAVAQGAGPHASVIGVGHHDARGDTLRALDTEGLDLLVIGGPTIYRGMSPGLGAMLEVIEGRLRGRAVATFDTRLRGPGLLLGSAARRVGKQVRAAGAHLVLPPAGFYVHRGAPASNGRPRPEDVTLIPGELDRARSWGGQLRDAIDARKAA